MTDEVICEMCQGEGQICLGERFVSHDMALDAGEPQMEGMHYGYEYGECPNCGGLGFIEEAK